MSEAYFDAGRRVLIIGLGRSGVASARVLRERGASVIAVDEKSADALGAALAQLETIGAGFVAADALDDALAGVTAAVLSPGVPLTSPLVRRVQEREIPVFSEIEVAYRLCAAPIVAITGTKGKTTTTALVGAMFRAAGFTTHVGGNIGNALIGETAQAEPEDWVIAEVSSFQLETIRSFKPRIAAILNLSPDHLDRYHSMEEYAEAKFRIFANQGPGDTFVANLDDPRLAELLAGGERAGQPRRGDSAGLLAEDNLKRLPGRRLWFARVHEKRVSLSLRGDQIVFWPVPDGARRVKVMHVDEIPLLGRHNVANVMAALTIGAAAGLDFAVMREAVRAFTPLPHRLQPIAEIDGVRYVDDSKATNPGAVVAALESFDRPVVLLAGGRSKRTDFTAMCDAIAKRARAVVLFGEASGELEAALEGRVEAVRAGSLEEAVARARSLARPGDAVLLSPGCTSLDMFSSAEARGDAFAAIVREREAARAC